MLIVVEFFGEPRTGEDDLMFLPLLLPFGVLASESYAKGQPDPLGQNPVDVQCWQAPFLPVISLPQESPPARLEKPKPCDLSCSGAVHRKSQQLFYARCASEPPTTETYSSCWRDKSPRERSIQYCREEIASDGPAERRTTPKIACELHPPRPRPYPQPFRNMASKESHK